MNGSLTPGKQPVPAPATHVPSPHVSTGPVQTGWLRSATAAAGRPALIAFVHRGHDWITGAEQCLLDLVGQIDPERFRSVVLCNAPIVAHAVEQLGVPAHLYPNWDDWTRPRDVAYARIRELLAELRPALIHVNMTTPLPGVLPYARRNRVPLVAHLHMPLVDRHERLHHFIHQADVAVGVAKHVVRPLYEDGMPAQRLRTIYNAVNAKRIEEGDATGFRATLGIPASAFVVLAVGSLIRRKGHDVTIRAVAQARARGTDAHLLVCGTGTGDDQEIEIQTLVTTLGLTDVVHLLGHRRDVGAIARDAADVLAASARAEALPLNVLEAQWAGLPVIASDIPAHHEAITSGRTGLLVPGDDPAALADAFVALDSDPERLNAFGEHSKEFAREHFSMDRYISDFETVYSHLLARPRRHFGWLGGSSWPRTYTDWALNAVSIRTGLRKPPPYVAPPF